MSRYYRGPEAPAPPGPRAPAWQHPRLSAQCCGGSAASDSAAGPGLLCRGLKPSVMMMRGAHSLIENDIWFRLVEPLPLGHGLLPPESSVPPSGPLPPPVPVRRQRLGCQPGQCRPGILLLACSSSVGVFTSHAIYSLPGCSAAQLPLLDGRERVEFVKACAWDTVS